MPDCIFCRIIKKEIPASVVYETDTVLAVRDLHPQAPIHILIIPKKHFSNLNEIPTAEISSLSDLFQALQAIARQLGIHEKGYRSVINTNLEGGQSVYHVHLHLLGGQQMGPSMVG